MLSAATDPNATLTPVPLPEAAFLFADVVGFTGFTELHGDARAATLAWRLRLGVEQQLGDDAHVIKTLGDAVMVRIADAGEAVAAGLRIAAEALPAASDPAVRVGVHWGPAVECDGDFFGAAVNVAARVVSLAGPGEVVVTDSVAVAARGLGTELERRGEHTLRGVREPVLLHAVRARAVPIEERPRARCPERRRRRAPWVLQPTAAGAHVQL